MDALCAGLNAEDASRLYEFPDGRQLILPLFRSRGLPRCLSVERSPLIGSLVSSGPASQMELQAIFNDLGKRRVLRTVVRPSALTGDVWASAAPPDLISIKRRSHVLDLQGGFEEVWKYRFNGQARRAIRKAEKAQIEVECDSTGRLLPVFYEMLQKSIVRWAQANHQPVFLARWRANRRDPIRRFQRMSDALGDAYRIWVAKVHGQPAAAIIVLFGDNAHYTRGAMDKGVAGPVRANFLLQK
ncbi:MAG: GNAT family N-acetyltransferase, partial [Woeseia sp.]